MDGDAPVPAALLISAEDISQRVCARGEPFLLITHTTMMGLTHL